MASADVIRYTEHPPSLRNDTNKQDQPFEEFSNLIKTIRNIRDKKIKDVVKIYQIVVDYSYKIDDPISIKHFLLETVEEINNDLIKNNKPYRVNFGDEMLNHFVDQNENYLKRKEFYDDDGTFNNFKLEDCLETLDKMKLLCQKNS